MSGSSEDCGPPVSKEPIIGTILGQTDGVDLTSRLMDQDKLKTVQEKAKFLSDFFSLQILTFASFAAESPQSVGKWSILETTGDGLVFRIDVTKASKDIVFDLYLQSLLEMQKILYKKMKIRIRSVSHFCDLDNLIYGGDIAFDKIFARFNSSGFLGYRLEAFNSGLYGEDRILLARLMAIAKGPFNILTHDFISALSSIGKHRLPADFGKFLAARNSDMRKPQIDPQPIAVPLMRGFQDRYTLKKPYLLWELPRAQKNQ